MKILSAEQLRAWDAYTIANEPITSLSLMERASAKIAEWLNKNKPAANHFIIFCGSGNNGGDGLAVARLLIQQNKQVAVYLLEPGIKQTEDFTANLQLLKKYPVEILQINSGADIPLLPEKAIVLEALYGSGLNRPLEGLAAHLVDFINSVPNEVISIDMPAGLLAGEHSGGNNIIRASHTLTFQTPKLSLFFAENEVYTGNWQVLDIGLHPGFQPSVYLEWVLENSHWLQLKKYRKHAHKGLLGHAMIVAGSRSKMGAAVMAARGCLHSGAGLLTMAVPNDCFDIIQTVTPEAMCRPQDDSGDEYFLQQAKINAVGVGPGWGETEAMYNLLEELIINIKCPLVIDATALFHLAKNPSLLLLRPKGSETILTPHIGEFARLFGSSSNSFLRLRTAIEKAKAFNVFIVLKGAFTQVITPAGLVYFNSTGNPGMAKGGSGDVLTGILTSLLAQRYPANLACILGVYAHGLAGDEAAKKFTQQAMTPMDIIRSLPKAWKIL
jgi:NAD(P)H-hydrate epimerase